MAAGVDAFDLRILPLRVPDTIDAMERLARDVLPALRGPVGGAAA